MKNRCGDCKYWGVRPHRPEEREIEGTHRVCGGVPGPGVNGAPYYNDRGESPENPESRPIAYVLDASDYHAVLRCREDFGCTLFEAEEITRYHGDGTTSKIKRKDFRF